MAENPIPIDVLLQEGEPLTLTTGSLTESSTGVRDPQDESNQDAMTCGPDEEIPNFICVLDGVGGVVGGRRASQLGNEKLKNRIQADLNEDSTLTQVEETMSQGLYDAAKAISEAANQDDEYVNMSSTVVAGYIHENKKNGKTHLVIGHIGDSRCIVYEDGEEIFQTIDESDLFIAVFEKTFNREVALVETLRLQRLFSTITDISQLSEEELAYWDRRNILSDDLRAIGDRSSKLNDDQEKLALFRKKVQKIELKANKKYRIAFVTDGITDVSTADEFKKIITDPNSHPQQSAIRAVNSVNVIEKQVPPSFRSKGYADDKTIVVVDVTPPDRFKTGRLPAPEDNLNTAPQSVLLQEPQTLQEVADAPVDGKQATELAIPVLGEAAEAVEDKTGQVLAVVGNQTFRIGDTVKMERSGSEVPEDSWTIIGEIDDGMKKIRLRGPNGDHKSVSAVWLAYFNSPTYNAIASKRDGADPNKLTGVVYVIDTPQQQRIYITEGQRVRVPFGKDSFQVGIVHSRNNGSVNIELGGMVRAYDTDEFKRIVQTVPQDFEPAERNDHAILLPRPAMQPVSEMTTGWVPSKAVEEIEAQRARAKNGESEFDPTRTLGKQELERLKRERAGEEVPSWEVAPGVRLAEGTLISTFSGSGRVKSVENGMVYFVKESGGSGNMPLRFFLERNPQFAQPAAEVAPSDSLEEVNGGEVVSAPEPEPAPDLMRRTITDYANPPRDWLPTTIGDLEGLASATPWQMPWAMQKLREAGVTPVIANMDFNTFERTILGLMKGADYSTFAKLPQVFKDAIITYRNSLR